MGRIDHRRIVIQNVGRSVVRRLQGWKGQVWHWTPVPFELVDKKGGDTVEEGAVLRPGAHEWLFKATGDGRHHLKKSDHGPKN